jgi:lipid II:glycine glycyltransferase (peptidoglycan interpeptide bridge formation enzyme)
MDRHLGYGVEMRSASMLSTAVMAAESSPPWDAFVVREGGDVVQSSAWAAFKQSLGMKVVRLVVRDGDTTVAGAQVVIRRVWSRLEIGYVPLGPVIATTAPTETTRALACALRDLDLGALIVQAPIGQDRATSALHAQGFKASHTAVAPSASIQIDLQHCDNGLLKQMKPHARREITARANEEIAVRVGTRRDLDSFYGLYRRTAERQAFQPLSMVYFDALWNALHHLGHLRLLLAKRNGVDIAANIVTCFGSKVTGKFVGSDPQALPRRYRPNEKLVWEIMTWARDAGYKTLDIGGIERAEALLLAQGRPVADPREPHKYKYGGHPVIAPPPLQRIESRLLRVGYVVAASTHFERLRPPLERVARSGRG